MKHYTVILLLLSYLSTSAQNYVDLLKVSWDEGNKTAFDDGNGTAQFREFAVDATVPIVLANNNAIITGALYERTSINASESIGDISIQGLALKLGLNWRHSNNWSGTYLLLPKLSADKLSFAHNTMQLGAIVILKKTMDQYRNFKIGFYTNTELFGPFIVPLLGYYYIDEKKEINIMAPLSAELYYRITANTKAGINFKGIIKSYELIDQPTYLTKANNEVSLSFQTLRNKILFTLDGGRTIGRNVRSFVDDDKLGLAVSALKLGDERVQKNTDFEDGWFLKAGIAFRLSTN